MTKRRGKAKRKSQRRARERSSNRLKSQEAQSQQTTGDTGAGAAVPMPMESRADRRFAARLMSLGIVSEEESAAILKRAFRFAAAADNVREYASAMRVVQVAAKLEMDQEKSKPANHVHGHVHLTTNTGRADVFAIAESLGLRVDIKEDDDDAIDVDSRPARDG